MAGTRSLNKGKKAERDFAAYLRSQGWPDANRFIRTGWRVKGRQSADEGDIRGTPGVTWQVKAYAGSVSDAVIAQWLAEAEEQARAAGNALALLVEKRDGKSDPGQWWCWVRAETLVFLVSGEPSVIPWAKHVAGELFSGVAPARLKVQHVAALLKEAGYASLAGAVS